MDQTGHSGRFDFSVRFQLSDLIASERGLHPRAGLRFQPVLVLGVSLRFRLLLRLKSSLFFQIRLGFLQGLPLLVTIDKALTVIGL